MSNLPHWQQSLWRVWALTKFELVRLFLTKRGLVALLAFATAWFFILYYPINSAVNFISSQNFSELAENLFGSLGLSALLNWAVPELAIYWLISLYSFTIFALIATSDQTCADRTRGTLRFISLRATRDEIIFGRFLGQVLIISLLIVITLVATIIMASWRDSSLLIPSLIKAAHLFLELFIAVLPFIALMTFFNSFLRSAKLTSVASLLFFGLGSIIVALLEFKIPTASYLHYIFPGIQLGDIVGQQSLAISNYIIPLTQTAIYLSFASILMKRSAL